MSRNFYFGNVTKRKNSTLQGSFTNLYNVLFKNPSSLDNPVLTLHHSGDFTYNGASYNGNYYFVKDKVALHNDLWEVHLELDALATHKSDILASTQFVAYSSQSGGSWLVDSRIPVLKSTTAAKNTTPTGILSNIGCYILSAVGKDRCMTYMIPLASTLEGLMSNIASWDASDVTDLLDNLDFSTNTQSALEGLSTVLARQSLMGNAYEAAPSCIRSCVWVPFDYALAPSIGYDTIWLGRYDSQVSGYKIKGDPVTGTATISIPWHFSDWRRASCEQVYLYLPLVGIVALSSDSLTQVSIITIKWSVTYTDGTIACEILAGNEIIGTYGGQCSSNYPIGFSQSASAGLIANTAIAGIEHTVAESVDAGLDVIGVAAEAGAGLLKTGWDVANAAFTSHPTCIGGIGGGAGSGLDLTIACYTVAHDTIVNPSAMAATMGLPTQKPIALSTLTGYCQCVNAHVALNADAPIMDKVDAYLNTGFYIE